MGVDNGDNLRRLDINRGAIWPDERDEKSKEGCENCCHNLDALDEPLAPQRFAVVGAVACTGSSPRICANKETVGPTVQSLHPRLIAP